MKFRLIIAFVLTIGLGFLETWAAAAPAMKVVPRVISPLTGVLGYSTNSEDGLHKDFTSAPAAVLQTPVSGGLYATDGLNLFMIDKTTGSAALIGPHGPVEIAIGALAFHGNGTLYGTSIGSGARLYTINTTNGVATAVGPLGFFVFEGGLAFDASGQLFGVNQGNAGNAAMFTINPTTGIATVLGPVPGENRDLNGLAFDGQKFYALDAIGNSLGTVSPATGSYTSIGNPGVTIGGFGGLAIDPSDGTLYAAFGSTGGFYVLDKSTGIATLIAQNNISYDLAFAPIRKNIYLPLILR